MKHRCIVYENALQLRSGFREDVQKFDETGLQFKAYFQYCCIETSAYRIVYLHSSMPKEKIMHYRFDEIELRCPENQFTDYLWCKLRPKQ